MPNEEDWSPPLEAASSLARAFGGITNAREAIAIGLREGLLRARAEEAFFLEEGKEEITELKATAESPIDISSHRPR